jgi:hypothetical protein
MEEGGGKAPLTILQKIQAAEDAILVFVVRLVECVVGEGCGCGGESKSRGELRVSGSRGKLGSGDRGRDVNVLLPTQFKFVYS